MSREVRRRPLVVEVRQIIELLRGQEPEIEQCAGNGRVHVARCEAHEWSEGKGHLR